MLEIKNLEVTVAGGKRLLRGVNLAIKKGEVHALMGPNGAGKSTLGYVLMGHPAYRVTNKTTPNGRGAISLDGVDVTALTPDQRAKAGLFLAFQYPVGIGGVTAEQLLKRALAAGQMGQKKVNAWEFRQRLTAQAQDLGVKAELTRRAINDGFSGGEKKRMEVLQLLVLAPKYAVLDESDSGLDVDALKIVARGIKQAAKRGTGMLLITHYQRILEYVKADWVHVMVGGKIAASGGPELAKRLEKEGYKNFA